MVKGYKRNIVLLKNTNSDVFDTAYFIMKDGLKDKNIDVIGEANRILEENTCAPSARIRRGLAMLLSFAIGMAVGTAVCALVMLLK